MAKGQGKRIPDNVRAQVIAALLQGQGVSEIAKTYKLPQSTVSRLKKEVPHEKLDEVGCKKRADIADRIGEFLDEGFDAIRNSLRVTQNDAWLSQQSASELATFMGVTADKIFRVLEAIEAANAQNENKE